MSDHQRRQSKRVAARKAAADQETSRKKAKVDAADADADGPSDRVPESLRADLESVVSSW